jgi:alcohol dehydrogenase class IV
MRSTLAWRHIGRATTTISGASALDDLAGELAALDRHRVYVVASPSVASGDAGAVVLRALEGAVVVGRYDKVQQHAPVSDLQAIATGLAESGADVVIAIGGGSPLDAAKGGMLLAAGRDLEIDPSLFSGSPVPPDGLLPLITVPTTLAGSEFGPGGAYTGDGHKSFFGAPGLASAISIYDARCFRSTPAGILCSTGMNGLAHCLESAYVPNGTPYLRALGETATRLYTRWLPERAAGNDGDEVLQGLMDAAILGALAYEARAGLHHAICHALGGMLGIPHAAANAVLLPYVMAFNEPASREIQRDLSDVMGVELARQQVSFGPALADRVQVLQALGRLPASLRDLGMSQEALEAIAEEIIAREPRLGLNPVPVTKDLLLGVLRAAWHGELAMVPA